ncbi:MAG: NAD-binding protein [Rhizobiaceae bacterium]
MAERVRLNWLLAPLFAVILVIGVIGHLAPGDTWFPTAWPTGREFLDALYRAIQLFVLEMQHEGGPGPLLQFARFAAAIFSIVTLLTLLVPRAILALRLRLQRRRRQRVVLLGYGPVGQSVAREFRFRRRHRFAVTAVHRGVTPELAITARRDGVLLAEGDPSDPAIYRRVFLPDSRKIVVALGDDMRTLDAAEAARGHVGRDGPEVSALLADPDIAAGLVDSSPRGFVGGPGIRGFSLAQESAQSLIADARFDRVALEAGQRRVHLVVFGCGKQGEAVAIETLLTGWRAGLGAPRITFLDRDIGPVEQRLRRRCPAFFIPDGAPDCLPPEARPELSFDELDASAVDFAADHSIERLAGDAAEVTAWVFATGDDTLNLRAALGLHTAMLRRQRAPALIAIRIWSGHAGDTPVLSSPHVSIARSFGSYESAIASTPACEPQADAAPRALHAQYVATGEAMRRQTPDFAFSDVAWSELSETKRSANRRLRRHAVMKLEDLEAQWRPGGRNELPVIGQELKDAHLKLEERFDYAALHAGVLPQVWWRQGQDFAPTAQELRRAERLKNIAIAEHNRWTVDRAVDGWRPTVGTDPRLRDEERRRHPGMHGWETLDAMTRRWDAVLLRALIEGSGEEGSRVTAWRKQVSVLTFAIGRDASGRMQPRWVGREPQLGSGFTTQIDLSIVGAPDPREARAAADAAGRMADALLAERGVLDRLCRLRFVFHAPPGAEILLVANAIAEAGAKRGIEVSSSWLWKKDDAPAVGFVGHRDLARLGGGAGMADHLQRLFAALVAEGRAARLVSGYAPGADRLAVDGWNALGLPRPDLVFPYVDPATGDFLTTEPMRATAEERLTRDAARKTGKPRLAAGGSDANEHVAQAMDVVDSCGVLVAVYDGEGDSGAGSVGDTIARAQAKGLPVILVTRAADGTWRNEQSAAA